MPRGPMRLKDLVPIAQQRGAGERRPGAARTRRDKGREVSCRRGCAACCRQIVPISAPEAFRLADHVLALDAPIRDRILARIDAVHDRKLPGHEASSPSWRSSPRAPTPTGRRWGNRYFDHRIACPFLHEEACGVYAERPLVCRHYAVTTTPASWCSAPTLHQIRTVPMPRPLSGALSDAAAALTGAPSEMIPLSTAMHWVDAHPEMGFLEWPGVDAVRAFIRALGVPEAEIGGGHDGGGPQTTWGYPNRARSEPLALRAVRVAAKGHRSPDGFVRTGGPASSASHRSRGDTVAR